MSISMEHFGKGKYKFCEYPELIENYDLAIKDSKKWDCHHRLETHYSDGKERQIHITQKELMALDMYYNRPPEELIFLTKSDHSLLHKNFSKFILGGEKSRFKKGQKPKHSSDFRKKMSLSYENRLNSKTINKIKKFDKIVVISGYFMASPDAHEGYRDYIKSAKSLGYPVLAILANKHQIMSKYGISDEIINRAYHLQKNGVDFTVTAIDKDGTVCKTLELLQKYTNVIFYKDCYSFEEIPERVVPNIQVIVGNNLKKASSSEILGLSKIKKE